MPHVLVVVEQFWHSTPGGTAQATEQTLVALSDPEFSGLEMSGVAARHSSGDRDRWPPASLRPKFGSRFALSTERLPRPALYESWLRLGRPSVDHLCQSDSVVWASSLIVPPTEQPVVATVHDLDFLRYPQFLTRRGRDFFPRMWAKAKQRAEVFVCPSQTVANDCIESGVNPDRVRVVHWGVEAPLLDETEAAKKASLMDLPDRFVLAVAPNEPRKNPEGMAAALASLDCDVVVVGPERAEAFGPDPLMVLGNRRRSLGFVDKPTLSALYRSASLLLYPSLAEGFGLPVLEAMAHGTPVVTSMATATEEVAAGAALLVDPHNVEEVRYAVSKVLDDELLAEELSQAGLARAQAMTWASTARGYADAFASVGGSTWSERAGTVGA